MGRMKVNEKDLVTPADEMTAADIKELAGVPRNKRLYERRGGKVLDDNEVVRTEGADLGAVGSLERGR